VPIATSEETLPVRSASASMPRAPISVTGRHTRRDRPLLLTLAVAD
jgi:hypothetical protein